MNQTKKCSACKTEKTLENFYLNPKLSYGVHSVCKKCSVYKAGIWAKNNPGKMAINGKKYRDSNVEKEKLRSKNYSVKNKESIQNYRLKYKQKNKDKINEYERNRRKKDNLFRIKGVTRCLLKDAFTRACDGKFPKKNKRSEDVIGCKFECLLKNLQKQFINWMSWDNQGCCKNLNYNCTWHIDHIIPVSYAKTEEEIYLLNHWSNLQPLCGKINIEKQSTVYPCTNLELKITFWETHYEII